MLPMQIYNRSICKSCNNILARTIKPLTEDYKIYLTEVFEIDCETTDCFIEQFRCLITNEDIDGIITNCNKYVPTISKKLIREYDF